MSTFTAVVTAHKESPHRILGNLLYQTRKPDEILCFLSDVPAPVVAEAREHFPAVQFVCTPNRNDWGHEKRALGVARATGDYVGFFNHDDSYDLQYIEKMMEAAEAGAEIVYCEWDVGHVVGFRSGSSTSGNFIVYTKLAQTAGYTKRDYPADGHFIRALSDMKPRIVKVEKELYFHNA